MAENTIDIAGASQDLQTIEDFVNLPAGSDVRPRLLPSVNVGTLSGIRDAIFENGGLPAEPFETLAKMNADGAGLPDGQLAMVHNDTANNGLYVKTAGAWVKSTYDPLAQSKTYTDGAKSSAISTAATDATTKADNAKTQAIADSKNYTNETVKGVAVYKKLDGRTDIILDKSDVARVLQTSAKTGEMVSYAKTSGSNQKPLVAGANVTISETDTTITINAAGIDPVFVEPTEFVLCLVIGQSNATYYGGDAALAPSVPDKVCQVWNNTYSTLHDINSGDATVTQFKESFAVAMALEFYKQTGMGLIVVNSAKGSTAQVAAADNGTGHWDTTSVLRTAAVDRYNACKTYLDTNNVQYQNGFIAWAQGEQDGQKIADSTITKAQYITALKDTVGYFKTNLGSKLPFIIVRTAYRSPDNAGYQAVRDGQMQVAHETDGAYMGYTGTYRFLTTSGLMGDNVHYSQVGKNMIGKALGNVASKLSAGVN